MDINLADAKTRLSELIERAAAGTTGIIRRGKPAAQIVPISRVPKPIDPASLAELTETMPRQSESAGEFLGRIREESRY